MSKEYYSNQVEFAPGIYAGFMMIFNFICLGLNDLIYILLAGVIVIFVFMKDNPLQHILNESKYKKTVFYLTLLIASVLPIFLNTALPYPENHLFAWISVPFNFVILFFLTMKIYTHKALLNLGWKQLGN